ncbi:MAG: GGDEF domain-containing protein, partial [Gemmatimonadales bacterium]
QALMGDVRDRVMLDHQFAAITEQEQAARHASLHDVLTGLPNRVLFKDRLEHGIAQAKRHEWVLAVMFVDLDKFKSINDSHGHDVGDSVLKTVSHRLKDGTRSGDTVSRIGGDEFIYLMMEIRDEASVAMVAGKIIDAIQAPMNISLSEPAFEVSIRASIGISMFPKDGTTADALITRADMAMYDAKQSKSGYAFAKYQSNARHVR